MGPRNKVHRSFGFLSERFLDHLDPYILLIHAEPAEVEHKLVFRFQNGFGVEILHPLLMGDKSSFFRVMVLKFMGSSMQDFKPVEYLPVPKVNWVDSQEDLMQVCQQVAQQPTSWIGTGIQERVAFSALRAD